MMQLYSQVIQEHVYQGVGKRTRTSSDCIASSVHTAEETGESLLTTSHNV